MLTRRRFLPFATLATAAITTPLARLLHAQSADPFRTLPSAFAQIEASIGGRLGVFVLDTGSNTHTGHREDERFALCSTFKSLLAAAVLQRADAGREILSRPIPIPATGLASHSPVTGPHAGRSLTVRELCEAAVTQSDNTAANLLLATVGGPPGITAFARSLGDHVTRLDRTETTLNEALPGDLRDTTSPARMVADWQQLLLKDTLSPASREQLTAWLIANTTGNESLRAGLPRSWRAGDKTGSNGETTTDDVAIVWPGSRPPVIIAAYLTACPGPETRRKAVLAEIGRLVASTLQS